MSNSERYCRKKVGPYRWPRESDKLCYQILIYILKTRSGTTHQAQMQGGK